MVNILLKGDNVVDVINALLGFERVLTIMMHHLLFEPLIFMLRDQIRNFCSVSRASQNTCPSVLYLDGSLQL